MTKKLLLADDSITIQKVIGIIFETEDYQLLVTDNGDDAFAMALDELPDLVIADISMPGKDGFELCQAIKSTPRLSSTSVMLLPGTFDPFDEQRAQEVGADGWLTKPFESQVLLSKVAQLLENEPLRVAGAVSTPAFAAAEESAAEFTLPDFEEGAVEGVAPVVDEAVLGLDDLDLVNAAAPTEESADDIWDAISFEDDDLSSSDEEAAESTFVADADEASAEPEEVEEVFTVSETYQPEAELSAEQGTDFDFAEDDSLTVPEEVVAAESVFNADEDSASDEPLELAALELESAELAPAEEETVGPAESYAFPADSDEESVELLSEELESPSFAATSVGYEELEPLHLSEETADVEELAAEEPAAAEMATSALPMFAASEAPAEEDLLDLTEDEEEILELADEDILDEEPRLEESCPEVPEQYDVAAESAAEPAPIEVETHVAEQPESLDVEEYPAADPEIVELEEEVVAEESFSVEEDDGFYFDASATEELAVAEASTEAAAEFGEVPVAAVVAAGLSPEAEIEQVEQQLRQLSEEDLREVVARVAGPIIEKLASEMLQQIAWDVVPDLAETMIREEIRKIKHADA